MRVRSTRRTLAKASPAYVAEFRSRLCSLLEEAGSSRSLSRVHVVCRCCTVFFLFFVFFKPIPMFTITFLVEVGVYFIFVAVYFQFCAASLSHCLWMSTNSSCKSITQPWVSLYFTWKKSVLVSYTGTYSLRLTKMGLCHRWMSAVSSR